MAFLTLAATAAYLALASRLSLSVAQMGLLFLGAAHVLETGADRLLVRARRDPEAEPLALSLSGLGTVVSVVSGLLMLQGGLANNVWLILGLVCVAMARVRSYAATSEEARLAEALGAGLLAQLLTCYGRREVYASWHGPLVALFGRDFPNALLPQMAVGAVSALLAVSPPCRRLAYLGACLHAVGAATALAGSLLAAFWGWYGLPLAVGTLALAALLAFTARYAYLVAVSLWALLASALAVLIALWGALVNASARDSLVLAALAVAGVLASLHFRVKAYLLFSSLALVLDATVFVVRQVLALSGAGAWALLGGGLAMIALAAVFERSRGAFMARLDTFRRQLESRD